MNVLPLGAEFFSAIRETTRRTDIHDEATTRCLHCFTNAPRNHKQLSYTANRWHVYSFLLTSIRIQQFVGVISLSQHEEC